MIDYNHVVKLARQLQNASYNHGMRDAEEDKSPSYYDKAYNSSEKAFSDLMEYIEKGEYK